ncbi:MAG: type 2 isopentenyl-diphosphate Delta-isomerase [Bacteroidetes bacterium]|nr:type 2 isopentenyl-diphosphate Delta-isomerase [Bacteroidota bacterium]
MSSAQRKADHVRVTTQLDSQYHTSTGFETLRLKHHALPECSLEEIQTETTLFEKKMAMPLIISSMTGGYDKGQTINQDLCQLAEKHQLAIGLGSQRSMLDRSTLPGKTESSDLPEGFRELRKYAPTALLFGNIGATQVAQQADSSRLMHLVDALEADALIVHLNPLQELTQPEGDRDFRGILKGIEKLVIHSHVPIIVKETGAGIHGGVAKKLLNVGVSAIDVAGAGGTSWARAEQLRHNDQSPRDLFSDWGIPTADCIQDVAPLKKDWTFVLIASGGLYSVADWAKALCLGADLVGVAQPIMKTYVEQGVYAVDELLGQWKKDLSKVMCLLGVTTLDELTPEKCYI